MNLLITGASGFLGSKMFAAYLSAGMASHVYSRVPMDGALSCHNVDVLDAAAVRDTIARIQPTHILHLASKGVTRDLSTLRDLLLSNTVGTDNVLDAAASLERKPQVFLLGTAYEYASSKTPSTESSPLEPSSPYAISKVASAHCMSRYRSRLSMHYLRLFNVYGPGEPQERLVPYIVESARAGRQITLTGCEQIRDFMFVDDLVSVLRSAVQHCSREVGAHFLNVGTGRPSMLKDVVVSTAQALRSRGIEPNIMFGGLPYRSDDPMFCVADNTELLRIIGPQDFTSVADGIGITVENLL